MQECDQFTCEPPQTCHRCTATRKNFLSSAVYQTKTVNTRRAQITEAAKGSGLHLRGMQSGPVVDWGEEEKPTHSPGPNSSHYEVFRTLCNAHLVFNAFWRIPHFCVHQMLMRDPMHQVDLGVIVHLIRAILRKFEECIENVLNIPGRAVARLQARFELMLAKRQGADGQR